MAANIFAGFFLLPLIKATTQSSCSAIMNENTVNEWTPAYAYGAALAGKADISLPKKSDGFARTANLTNLCQPVSLPSNQFQLKADAETFVAQATAAQSTQLLLSGATCTLTGLALYKTQHASREMELRLQFDTCAGGPPGLAAGVVMGIAKDPTNAASPTLLPWVQEKIKAAAPKPEAPQTTAAPSQIQHESNDVVFEVGNGKCNGQEFASMPFSIPEKAECKGRCVFATRQADLSNTGDKCTGYAFNVQNSSCILYKSAVSTSNNAADWACANLTMTAGNVVDVTTVPPPAITSTPPDVLHLDFTQVLQASQTSTLVQVSPPTAEPSCFKPVWWLQLEDREGKPTSMLLKSVDYDNLLKLLKTTTAYNTSKMRAPRVMDRVLVDSCSHIQWDGTVCQVAAPKFSNPVCTSNAMANAIVTGICTALVTWLIVGLVFFLMTSHFRRSDGFEHLQSKVCTAQIALSLSVVAILAAGGSAFGFMQLVNEMLRSQTCYDFDETLVIMLSASLSAGLAIVIILQYIYRKHPLHPHAPFTQKAQTPATEQETHLALVEVEESKDFKVGQRIPLPGEPGATGSAFRSGGSFNTLNSNREHDPRHIREDGGFESFTQVLYSR